MTQCINRRLAFLIGHAVGVELEPQMCGTGPFWLLHQPDHRRIRDVHRGKQRLLMSEMGHSRRFGSGRGSAHSHIPDILRARFIRCDVPKSAMSGRSKVPFYSITSSARASSVGGTVRPSLRRGRSNRRCRRSESLSAEQRSRSRPSSRHFVKAWASSSIATCLSSPVRRTADHRHGRLLRTRHERPKRPCGEPFLMRDDSEPSSPVQLRRASVLQHRFLDKFDVGVT
jgi:hypothetical protein